MAVKFSPSVNIIRDSKKELNYIVTPNAERASSLLVDGFRKGIHAFTIIGTYGTGKSSFLWALQKSLTSNATYLKTPFVTSNGPVKFLNFVGTYQSIIDHFSETLEVKNSLKGNQKIFDAIYQEYEKVRSRNGLLIIAIDEFGKFLEYAAKHNPEAELYFVQQLAEFVNEENRNILLITTLHQNFDAYTGKDLNDTQRQEWKKVKGRLSEITFNEPIEQLLLLVADSIGQKNTNSSKSAELIKLQEKFNVLSVDRKLFDQLGDRLRPLDIFSASVLTRALQLYGQNDRSVFSFLALGGLLNSASYTVSDVYDYLYNEFYYQLSSQNNFDYSFWSSLRGAIERAEYEIEDSTTACKILKTIGLLRLFGSKASRINEEFIEGYFKVTEGHKKASSVLKELVKKQIIRFSKYNESFKLYEGSDVNIEEELRHAAAEVSDEIDVVKKLKEYFELSYITAKAVSYRKGTPRFFSFEISDSLNERLPQGEIDGYINLIINPRLSLDQVKDASKKSDDAILFGRFSNSKRIQEALYDLEKTKIVISRNSDDKVAKRELENILTSQRELLTHFVLGAFYSGDVTWIYSGKIITIKNSRQLNHQLSEICDDVYKDTPTFSNELINKHSISRPIHLARKDYFASLVKSSDKPDIGFSKESFPPEKTIYISLLRETNIHIRDIGTRGWDFESNLKKSTLLKLWNASEAFLESCKSEKRPLSEFFDCLSSRPIKMKQGFLEFWIPTFLFIKRDDFALYGDNGYVPELNDSILYLFNRNTKEFYIKTFDVRGVKLNLYNRYRDFLQLKKEKRVSNKSFIESIRPFLVLHKQLTEYAKNTNRLSPETIEIRKAIENSEDPEKVFFEDFPKAFKTNFKQLSSSPKSLETYISNLNEAIRELRICLDEFIDRIEVFIIQELIGKKNAKFPLYKNILQDRYRNLKEHQLLSKQKALLIRINSPLDERRSWITSIVHSVMGKSIDTFRDEDEEILKDRLSFMIQEMDNLVEIVDENGNLEDETIKIDLTTSQGLLRQIIRIPVNKNEEIKKQDREIRRHLSKDKRVNLAVLSQLLKEQSK